MDLKILDKNGEVRFSHSAREIDTVFNGEFSEGDKIVVSATLCEFLTISLDDVLGEVTIFNPQGRFEYEIPSKEFSIMYSDETFAGETHKIKVREATDEEAFGVRNIALNPYDMRWQKKYFPHASANFVTRDNPGFFERNAIDGVHETAGHGS